MRISDEERAAIGAVLRAGAKFGYGNLIAHLQTGWARMLMARYGMDEGAARHASGGRGYLFAMQDDLLERGEWDEIGERYRSRKEK